MKQRSLASQSVFEKYGRKSRRELFLDEMEQVVPWPELLALVEPHYAKAGKGRHPVGLSIMLRTYFVQQWFKLSDPGVEEALYESPVVQRVVGVDLGLAPAPDETTVLRFRHLLEKHSRGGQMLDTVNEHLESNGIKIQTGTIVDASIIHAPSSTKNENKQRDPEMHQTKKSNQWFFGLKTHIGVDAKQGHVTRWLRLRPTSRTCLCCPICCTVRSARCGETAATRASLRRSSRPRRRLRT